MQNVIEKAGTRFALMLLAGFAAASAAVAEPASPWVEGFNNKARLLAGKAAAPGEAAALYAGLEIQMPPGWKTYWRTPGDAGGIPPEFNFAGSENLAKAVPLFPAPKKLVDRTGTTYGYKERVIFPIAIAPEDSAKPVVVKLKATYGVCEELCVPAEAELSIIIEPDAESAADLTEALAHVPRKQPIRDIDPVVDKVERLDRSGKPLLRLTATAASGDGAAIEAFFDSGDGIYLPVPKKISADGGKAVFELDLTDGVNVKDLEGKQISVTLTDASGSSETAFALPEPIKSK